MDPQSTPPGSGQVVPGVIPSTPPPVPPMGPGQAGEPVAPPPPGSVVPPPVGGMPGGDQKPHEQILAAIATLQQKVDAIAAKVGV